MWNILVVYVQLVAGHLKLKGGEREEFLGPKCGSMKSGIEIPPQTISRSVMVDSSWGFML